MTAVYFGTSYYTEYYRYFWISHFLWCGLYRRGSVTYDGGMCLPILSGVIYMSALLLDFHHVLVITDF